MKPHKQLDNLLWHTIAPYFQPRMDCKFSKDNFKMEMRLEAPPETDWITVINLIPYLAKIIKNES